MDVPHMRSDGVRAAAEHALHDPRRACDSTNLQPDLDPPGAGYHPADLIRADRDNEVELASPQVTVCGDAS